MLNKKVRKNLIILGAFIMIISISIITASCASKDENIQGQISKAETDTEMKEYQNEYYSISLKSDWTIEEVNNVHTNIYDGNDFRVSIDVNDDCNYCGTTKSIITNLFGLHGKSISESEQMVGKYKLIKTEIEYEQSAAQEQESEKNENELHYIYTDNEKILIDLNFGTKAGEKEIDTLIDSFKIIDGKK